MQKNKNQSKRRVIFGGFFTPEIRARLFERRKSLGLSYTNLGNFMNVSWSTIRKWECGPTKICDVSHRILLENFLNGDFDEILQRIQGDAYKHYGISRFLPMAVHACIQRISNTYMICRGMPELKNRLLNELDASINDILNQLIVSTEVRSPKRKEKKHDIE